MSVALFGQIWETYPASGDELVVMLALADRADISGSGSVNLKTVSLMCRSNPDSVLCIINRNSDIEIRDYNCQTMSLQYTITWGATT